MDSVTSGRVRWARLQPLPVLLRLLVTKQSSATLSPGSSACNFPTLVAAFHYIHPAYGNVFMFFLLKPFHVKRREKVHGHFLLEIDQQFSYEVSLSSTSPLSIQIWKCRFLKTYKKLPKLHLWQPT